jgi:uncharacterized membrane protein YkvA (DUF1232 family)
MNPFSKAVKIVKFVRRHGGPKAVTLIALSAPKYLTLYRKLLMDQRVPKHAKIALLAAAGFAVSPLNIPNYIPVLGAMDDLAIIALANGYFMRQIPAAVLDEHRNAVGLDPDLP